MNRREFLLGFLGASSLAALSSYLPNNSEAAEKTRREQKQKPQQVEQSKKQTYSSNELLLARVMYAEAAGEKRKARELIGLEVLNRAKDSRFPSTIPGVVFQSGAYSCVNGKLWRQSRGSMTLEQKQVYQECLQDARELIAGQKPGISLEEKIIAHHDNSISKPKTKFWRQRTPIYKSGDLIFYR